MADASTEQQYALDPAGVTDLTKVYDGRYAAQGHSHQLSALGGTLGASQIAEGTITLAMLSDELKEAISKGGSGDAPFFYVTYDANGGAGDMPYETREYGKAEAITANAFTYEAHAFLGWVDQNGTTYAAGQAIDGTGFQGSTMRLKARWRAYAYTIAFSGNGATGGSTESIEAECGTDYELPANGFEKKFRVNFDWNGGSGSGSYRTATFAFDHWDTAANGGGTDYAPGQTVRNLTTTDGATFTLHAIWSGGSVSLPTSGTRDEYTFLGWATSSGATSAAYTSSFTPTSDGQTLYAVWKQNKITHTAAEWAANPADLKVAADDIAANGENSVYYADFKAFMDADTSFPFQLRNVDSWTSNAEDKVMQCRIVGLNCKTKTAGGKAGITFMAKKAHPKASVINTANSTSGGYPSMPIRTYLNSGDFWNSLPAALQSVIAEVSNTAYGSSGSQVTSSDKLWLASWYELCGSDSSTSYQTKDGPQFPFFASKGTTNDGVKSTLANMYLTNSGAQPSGLGNTRFWARSVCPYSTGSFVFVSSDGTRNGNYPDSAYAVAPCFSL